MRNFTAKIETERLLLRTPIAEDFEPWVALMADPVAAKHIGGVQPRELVWRGFMTMAGAWAINGFAMFSVIEKPSGRWIGRVGPWQPEGWPGTEVGWALVRDAWGKGYASESAIATIDWSFDRLGWSDVIHSIASDNSASKAVAQRLGSRYLRMAKLPPPFDNMTVEIWGQSREQWQAQRARLPLDVID
ncbi:MAG: GNAT family N-acetyltransferase [Dokdonella sp.]